VNAEVGGSSPLGHPNLTRRKLLAALCRCAGAFYAYMVVLPFVHRVYEGRPDREYALCAILGAPSCWLAFAAAREIRAGEPSARATAAKALAASAAAAAVLLYLIGPAIDRLAAAFLLFGPVVFALALAAL
jgi:hypothetical protein